MTNPCPVDRDARQYAHQEGVREGLIEYIHEQIRDLTEQPMEDLANHKSFTLCGRTYTPGQFLDDILTEDTSPSKWFNTLAAYHLINLCELNSDRFVMEQGCKDAGYLE